MSEKNEKYIEYFNERCVEDREHIETICRTAASIIYKRFKANFDDDAILVGSTFSKIFEVCIKQLMTFHEKYSEFKINLFNRLEIGYDNNNDEENEKVGNFMIFLIPLSIDKKDDSVLDPDAKAAQLATEWLSQNSINTPKTLSKISVDALDALKDIDINIGISELIFPIFITVYETLVNYIKIKRKETNEFEFEINFLSCFSIGFRESAEDETGDIYIRPSIGLKLDFKSDHKASAPEEE